MVNIYKHSIFAAPVCVAVETSCAQVFQSLKHGWLPSQGNLKFHLSTLIIKTNKKMKTLRKIGIVLMSVFMIAGLGACGDDDDNDNSQGDHDSGGPTVYAECPDGNHPHLIDLGLPSGTKWACCNVGASKPEASGGYYAWGETEEKTVYNEGTYLYCNNGWIHIGNNISGTEYDVARVKWGAPWRMPSLDEMSELRDKCTREWTQQNGVNGIRVTGPNGKSIFLPAAGDRWGEHLDDYGSHGYYWSGTLYSGYEYNACSLYFGSGYWYWSIFSRGPGFSVRPVAE